MSKGIIVLRKITGRPTFALAAAAAVMLVTACGSSSSGASNNGESAKTGPQVVKDAAAALGASGAAHLAGTMTDSGSKQSIKVDVQLQSDGTSGVLTLGGNPVNIISTGRVNYVKTTAAFFIAQKVNATIAAKLANRWVILPASSSSDFDTFTLSALSKSLADPNQSGSAIENKVSTGSLNGEKVVIVNQADGSQLFVAASGKPYPLKAVNSTRSKDGSGTLIFTGYGKHQTIKAPVGAVDLSTAPA